MKFRELNQNSEELLDILKVILKVLLDCKRLPVNIYQVINKLVFNLYYLPFKILKALSNLLQFNLMQY